MALIQGIAHIRVFVRPRQRKAARTFYCKTLGLKRLDDDLYALPGGLTLGIEAVDSKDHEADLVGRLLAMSFRVTDVRQAYRRLRSKGVRFHGPPERQPWGGTLAFLDDPSGNILTLAEYP